ncbi:MAG: sortase [Chloroflexi bacterium]|nr:MAG: sortase [Chloroflexota bacterium]
MRIERSRSSEESPLRWLATLLTWGGVLMMLVGGLMAYPILRDLVRVSEEAEALEFVATLPPASAPTAVPLAALPSPVPTLTSTASPTPGQPQEPAQPAVLPSSPQEEEASQDPPPLVLPETALLSAEEATPGPTATPPPTPDPASLIPVRLVIPAINLDAPVVPVGWETKEVNGQLVSTWIVPNAREAGWHKTSALPGEPGNTVLNGHHNIYGEVFRDLVELEPGDAIYLYTGQRVYHYQVTERHILKEKGEPIEVRIQNAQWIMPTDDERLTLITCWPYTNNTHRLVVVARPLPDSGSDLSEAERMPPQ